MILYAIFLLVGALLLVAGIKELQRKLNFARKAERAMGKVIKLDEHCDQEGVTVYYPKFEIPTTGHGIITYRSSTGYGPEKYQVGQMVHFIFDPAKPETAQYLSTWRIFGAPLCLLALAVDLLLIGAGYFLLRGYIGV
ncbi:DUF3592 domain-containing protein [Chitinophaga sp. CB10]|uniref:DUF3592 domain-containing protein n=1 Tax=Chitinophaga sp. CB10 TaxID=1891659 RepID=UPI0025BFE9BE|nr:DUF3592 domain-containing protein [Chitinophaga sp. CB10]